MCVCVWNLPPNPQTSLGDIPLNCNFVWRNRWYAMVRRPSVIGGIWHGRAGRPHGDAKGTTQESCQWDTARIQHMSEHLPGWCYTYPSEKYEFVSWDYYSQYIIIYIYTYIYIHIYIYIHTYIYIYEKKNVSKPPTQSSPESVDENFPAIPSSSQYQSQLFHRRQVTSAPLWTQRLVIPLYLTIYRGVKWWKWW